MVHVRAPSTPNTHGMVIFFMNNSMNCKKINNWITIWNKTKVFYRNPGPNSNYSASTLPIFLYGRFFLQYSYIGAHFRPISYIFAKKHCDSLMQGCQQYKKYKNYIKRYKSILKWKKSTKSTKKSLKISAIFCYFA